MEVVVDVTEGTPEGDLLVKDLMASASKTAKIALEDTRERVLCREIGISWLAEINIGLLHFLNIPQP